MDTKKMFESRYVVTRGLLLTLTFLVALLGAPVANAASPTCHETSGASYCKYTGKVKSLYINDKNLILVFFDEPLDVAQANAVGIPINVGDAASYPAAENVQFAEMLYSTLLAAQASKREVLMQMRGVAGTRAKIDRIWLKEE